MNKKIYKNIPVSENSYDYLKKLSVSRSESFSETIFYLITCHEQQHELKIFEDNLNKKMDNMIKTLNENYRLNQSLKKFLV